MENILHPSHNTVLSLSSVQELTGTQSLLQKAEALSLPQGAKQPLHPEMVSDLQFTYFLIGNME